MTKSELLRDSVNVDTNTVSFNDPAQNRLFWMSTGQTMPDGKFSITSFEIFSLQFGYSPIKNLQLNFSTYVYPILFDENTYWSMGTKIQLLPPKRNFYGLSIGVDVGFIDKIGRISSSLEKSIHSLNIATSFGTERFLTHVSASQLQFLSKNRREVPIPTFIQIGTEISLKKTNEGKGSKLIAESFFTPNDERKISFSTFIVGFRFYSQSTVAEIALPFSTFGFFNSATTNPRFIFPWGSLTFIF